MEEGGDPRRSFLIEFAEEQSFGCNFLLPPFSLLRVAPPPTPPEVARFLPLYSFDFRQ